MSAYVWEILLILALVLVNGYFAAAEIALISARRAILVRAAEEGSAGAKAALDVMSDPSRLLATTQIGITVVGFMASAAAAVSVATLLEAWLRGLPFPGAAKVAGALSVVLVTIGVSYLTLVLGELAPKRLGLRYAESVAQKVSRPVALVSTIAAPAVWLLSRSADVVAGLLGVEPGGRPGVTEEEIKLLVTEQGTLLDEEKRMIHEIFELGDTVVREIMVPRVDSVMVPDTESLDHVMEVFRRTGFSRLPVYHEEPDRIVGVLLLKDLVLAGRPGGLEAGALADVMRPPFFVPESKPILGLLAEMRSTRNHIAIVVDEYGGTAGLATIEDIVEEIVGEISDEFDSEHQYVHQVSEGEWVVDGRLPIEEAQARLGLPIEESEEYDTLAGWVLMQLGHIPVPGEEVGLDGFTIGVQTMRRRRIVRLGVRSAGSGGEAPGTAEPAGLRAGGQKEATS